MSPIMATAPLTIFVNQKFPDASANALLVDSLHAHRVAFAASITTSNLAASAHDPAIDDADVAFGQPDPASVIATAGLKWVHLTSAGYDRYDRDDVRTALTSRGGMLTNSSSVYEEPCAQHALAMILAQCRQLPWAADNQRGNKSWPAAAIRRESRLLVGQKVLLLSYGAIARRLVELLTPFDCDIVAVRRRPAGDEAVKTVSETELEQYLPHADHVVNILPGGQATRGFMSPARFGLMKAEGSFYNIGRGTTVDQDALLEALKARKIAAAWLDVTDPEPLPSYHPLWTAPNCHITPHTAGGHHDEFHRLVRHFLGNLERYGRGDGLRDRVI
jgi:phosphoglycerate dehydrogenase-like enzyme